MHASSLRKYVVYKPLTVPKDQRRDVKLCSDVKIMCVLSRDRYIVIRPSSISEKGGICARVGSTVDFINEIIIIVVNPEIEALWMDPTVRYRAEVRALGN